MHVHVDDISYLDVLKAKIVAGIADRQQILHLATLQPVPGTVAKLFHDGNVIDLPCQDVAPPEGNLQVRIY